MVKRHNLPGKPRPSGLGGEPEPLDDCPWGELEYNHGIQKAIAGHILHSVSYCFRN